MLVRRGIGVWGRVREVYNYQSAKIVRWKPNVTYHFFLSLQCKIWFWLVSTINTRKICVAEHHKPFCTFACYAYILFLPKQLINGPFPLINAFAKCIISGCFLGFKIICIFLCGELSSFSQSGGCPDLRFSLFLTTATEVCPLLWADTSEKTTKENYAQCYQTALMAHLVCLPPKCRRAGVQILP